MKIRSAVVLGLVLLFGTAAFAQDYPKIEIPLDYSYMRFNPEHSDTLGSFSLNGGGGGVTYNFSHMIGIEAEFNGYASQTRIFSLAAGSTHCPTGCSGSVSADLFTYNVGPVVKYRTPHYEPFVEVLFGGAHSNAYGNLLKACQNSCVTSGSPSNNAFDFVIGGGIDIPVTKSIAIRPAQFDFVLTRFGNGFTAGNTNQSNFRYQAGIIIRF
jgi:opacity protein-like surface antigen